MKKLLATTAIASVAFAGASFAEMKISGEIAQTWTSTSYDKASEADHGTSAIGSETNLKFSGSKELDNGMTAGGYIRIEDKGGTLANDSKIFSLTSGNLTVTAGIDHGTTIDGNVVANVGQQVEDVLGVLDQTGTDPATAKAASLTGNDAHDKEHIGVAYKTDMGTFQINYSPDVSQASNAENSTDDAGASATEIVFSGGLGVDGLTVKLGQQETKKEGGVDNGDKKEQMFGIMYNFGQFSVATSHRDYDDGDTSASNIDGAQSYSVSFAANDQLSVSLELATVEKEGSGAKDEDSQLLGVSYNLGGLGVEAYYGKVENIGNGTSVGDGEVFQLRSVLAF
jgi:hypothetical protein